MQKKIRIQIAIVIYLIFIGFIIVSKPKHFYKNDGSGTLKTFGTGPNNTIFPLWFVIFLGAFMSYYLTHVIIFALLKKM